MEIKNPAFICPVVVLILHCLLISPCTAKPNITTDQSALLAIKAHIASDPHEVVKNWTITSSVCSWIGVTCGKRHRRVTGLNISNVDLTGSIPPELGNLSFLVSFDVSHNNFGGTLPMHLAGLRRLRFMRIGYNRFTGEIPSYSSSFPKLQLLSIPNNSFTSMNLFLLSSKNRSKLVSLTMSFNSFQGQLPESLGNLQSLKELFMEGNSFSGPIPPSIMNLSSLETLALTRNLLQGPIPKVIGNLRKLNFLALEDNQLSGPIPSSIFNISSLKLIGFTNNSLSGALPNDMCIGLPLLKGFYVSLNNIQGQIPSNISSCRQLKFLSLSYNDFTGTIPHEIGSLETLQRLNLADNNLTGKIPTEIGKLYKLQHLSLTRNKLTGSIPSSIFNMSFLGYLSLRENELNGFITEDFGNLTMLQGLYLDNNHFSGVIPPIFGKLRELTVIYLNRNHLSNPIPSCIFNASSLQIIGLAENNFSGNIPVDIGSYLPNLKELYLRQNNFDGVLPDSIANSSQLNILELSVNMFRGPVPNSLGDLKFLQILNIQMNNFSSESASSTLSFFTSLTRSKSLINLGISFNPLNGILPRSMGNLSSSLRIFYATNCLIKGHIPNELSNLRRLVMLSLDGNDLVGGIPSALHVMSNLQKLDLGNNQLTGVIPDSFCKFEKLGAMSLDQNQLTGSIPSCLGNVSSLREIHLNSNNLTSSIPSSIWSLLDLSELDVSSNSFTGSVSPQIGNLKSATLINLSMNQLSNEIPTTVGHLQMVTTFSLAYNRLQGSIPESMHSMLSLISLDLSHNMLSGIIPKSMESLTHLQYFNVSFNKLSGEIPSSGPFKNFTSQSFMFNAGLCGSPRFNVSPCAESGHKSRKHIFLRIVFIVLGIAALICIGVAFLMVQHRKKMESPMVPDIFPRSVPARIPYYKLWQATNGYSEDNLLGRGSFGSVYKGVLEDGNVLAVKVFNMLLEAASNTFHAECEVLRNVRHVNLIKVIGSCANQDFKALVLEYMPNGSLEKWLHSENYFLDIMQRLNIMTHVASALEYLHHGYSTPVVHCDLKPSNVLMDQDLVAHVSDFGITKFLGREESMTHTRTLATLGYMAPEYGSEGRVSIKCDVYSYGIMLLETFTKKRPSDEMFSGDMSLKRWVKDSLPHAPSEVVDASMLRSEDMNASKNLRYASTVLDLALRCAADSPRERMNMKDVLVELKKIKVHLMQGSVSTNNTPQ